MYILSNRRHCWTLMYFLFLWSEKWGHHSERQNKYFLLSNTNLGPKLLLRLMGELLECLSLQGSHSQNCKSYIWNNHHLKASKISYISMWSKRCGIQIKLKIFFSPVLAALHRSYDVTHYSSHNTHQTVPDCHAMLQRRVSQDSPTTSRDLRYSGRISSTPSALPPRSLPTTSVTSAWVINKSPAPASSMEGVSVGLRRSSKYSFHCLTISPVEVNSSPPPP